MIRTLHTAELGGVKVRFFRSPRAGADMPYVSVLDLLSATRFPVGDRKVYMDNLPREFPQEVDTFAVAEEATTAIVRVCTHGMAMGIVGIGQHIGSADIDMAYRLAALEALNKVVAELRLGKQEAFDYSLRAVMR